MKTYFITCCGLILLLFPLLLSCDDKPGFSALNTLEEKFPDARSVEWEQEDGGWEAEFTVNGVEHSATFDKNGKWLETEKQISVDNVPATVINSIKATHANARIAAVYEESGTVGTSYEFELVDGDHMLEVELDANGNLVKEEDDEGEDDDDAQGEDEDDDEDDDDDDEDDDKDNGDSDEDENDHYDFDRDSHSSRQAYVRSLSC